MDKTKMERIRSTEKLTVRVKFIKDKEIEKVLDSVALAYENYPLFNYLLGSESKAESIKQIIMSSLKAIKYEFIGISVGEDSEVVAIFMKPNYKGSPAVPFLLQGGIKLIFKYSFGILFRLLNYENYAMRLKEKYSDDNCWYLYSLTVHPDYQHNGLATKVMQPMLDFFDNTGQSCYLETNKECNVAMYEHFGFTLLEKGEIPGTNIVHYALRREPKLR